LESGCSLILASHFKRLPNSVIGIPHHFQYTLSFGIKPPFQQTQFIADIQTKPKREKQIAMRMVPFCAFSYFDTDHVGFVFFVSPNIFLIWF
jgi:hypothetical protein